MAKWNLECAFERAIQIERAIKVLHKWVINKLEVILANAYIAFAHTI